MSYAAVGILAEINGTCQAVSYDATTAQTTAHTREGAFEVTTTTACHMHYSLTATAVATTADLYLAAGIPRQFPMHPNFKTAFIKASGGTAGIAYVTEMNP